MAARFPWRQAATLILAKNSEGVSRDITEFKERQLKVLYIKRATKASDVFSSLHTFPGGTLDSADISDKWWRIYERLSSKLGLASVHKLFGSTLRFDNELLLYKQAGEHEGRMPAHIAFRICAIRELFEETGLLLCLGMEKLNWLEFSISCKEGSTHFNQVSNLSEWRELVHNNANRFIDLCSEYNCVPNVWSLVEWSNWLTPAFLSKRWDTVFYYATMKYGYSPSADNMEVSSVDWLEPIEVLQRASKGELSIAIPTAYESSRINRFYGVEMLDRFARWRVENYSCSRLSPVIIVASSEMFVTTFPKDNFYERSQVKQKKEIVNTEQNQEIVLNTNGLVNRYIRTGPSNFSIVCNAVPADGHLIPSLMIPGRITSKL
ncbi:Nucleoside diphosphate-linked moiety X motif 19, mitochondrial-like [Oopsacas minuta]|uniref:Nucleoside diphosphate-linked moiety X motif 19, mitochondrial-like n=1 Tax=Oopsacas minuta TaxID=111878 RepID=A0AAV7JT80_9METZ|nr:Nucleoside diphosphate-linked moiety X motif 19, mitochondrial-like [Oopsacas minuta]